MHIGVRADWRRIVCAAYLLSGFSGLTYQVTWTRLLGLSVGHGTSAIAIVVAGFMGGLAIGSASGTYWARHTTNRRTALTIYAALEVAAATCALLLPWFLDAVQPLLTWRYANGAGAGSYAALRTIVSLMAMTPPAILLGATFPIAVRAIDDTTSTRNVGSRLYALNATGAAAGALMAGFVWLPRIGLFATSCVGVLAGLTAAALAMSVRGAAPPPLAADRSPGHPRDTAHRRPGARLTSAAPDATGISTAAGVMAASGLAGMLYEIGWTRAVAALLGPTTYAFSAAACTVITGLAAGAAIGNRLATPRRSSRPALTIILCITVLILYIGNLALGTAVPRSLAQTFADHTQTLDAVGLIRMGWVYLLMLPAAAGMGAAFSLALDLATRARPDRESAGLLYAVNAAASVIGALCSGGIITVFGLERMLQMTPALLAIAAVIVIAGNADARPATRILWAGGTFAGAVAMMAAPPAWDRDLLASGVYKYARTISSPADVESLLKAGTVTFYRDGASSTVSVSQLLGRTSLAIDGKVDGSNGSDMLTQTLLAHIPLLLHERPRDVLVIGLGTGVTAASAARHPVERVDVVEISPEVAEASREFARENGQVLSNPKVHLILGDGRSHLALSTRRYDVIISEPSNPWMSGVAALFTREAFASARLRLAPGGIVCQWVHTYDINAADLRSIVATFRSVFPDATMWTIGETDMLLVAGDQPLDVRLPNVATSWRRAGVAEDLAAVGAINPFTVQSLLTGGPGAVAALAGDATIQRDDRMALEFTGPAAAYSRVGMNQSAAVRRVAGFDVPMAVQQALARATATDWTARAAMLHRTGIIDAAYADYRHAAELDSTNRDALFGMVATAVTPDHAREARTLLQRAATDSPTASAALSRLLAQEGDLAAAMDVIERARQHHPDDPLVLQQLGSFFADGGDVNALAGIVMQLTRAQPADAKTLYFGATLSFMRQRFDEALTLARQATAADATSADGFNLVGAALASLGRQDEARRAFEAALQRAPTDPSIYTNLGLLSLNAGDRPKARKFFASALSLDPSLSAARTGLAQSLDHR